MYIHLRILCLFVTHFPGGLLIPRSSSQIAAAGAETKRTDSPETIGQRNEGNEEIFLERKPNWWIYANILYSCTHINSIYIYIYIILQYLLAYKLISIPIQIIWKITDHWKLEIQGSLVFEIAAFLCPKLGSNKTSGAPCSEARESLVRWHKVFSCLIHGCWTKNRGKKTTQNIKMDVSKK